MTREEVLNSGWDGHPDACLAAMEIYAKRFAEWLGNQSDFEYDGTDWYSNFEDATHTTTSLLKRFDTEMKYKSK